MKYVEINGEKKRFVFSVRAISAFFDSLKPKTDEKGNVIETDADNGMEEVLNWAYTGLKFGAKADKVKFDLTKEDIESWLDENFDQMCEIASYCRNQLKLFQNAVAGNYEASENGKQETKKKILS